MSCLNMSQSLLFIQLLLVHFATQTEIEIQANCNDDVVLPCAGVDTANIDYRSVTWYKIQLTQEDKVGIIRMGKSPGDQKTYDPTSSARFGEKHSLLLFGVKPKHSGMYECAITANIGSRNLNPKVNLTVNECVTEPEPTTESVVMNTTHLAMALCTTQVEELPITWSIGGYTVVCLGKIILSVVSILVVRAVRNRSSKRRQQKW